MKSIIQKSISFGIASWNFLLIIIVSFGCSKDDPQPSVFINTQQTQVSFTKVNGCHAGSGVHYTQFDFTIPYQTSSPDIEIEKVLQSLAVVGGTAAIEDEDYSFDDDGSEISFSLCIRFAGAPAVDFTSTLVSKDGHKSKASKITIDKPTGAN